MSSWKEYTLKNCSENFCEKDIVLDQFSSIEKYRDFAEEALGIIQEKKEEDKEIKTLAID